jgi:hypothetical protein
MDSPQTVQVNVADGLDILVWKLATRQWLDLDPTKRVALLHLFAMLFCYLRRSARAAM